MHANSPPVDIIIAQLKHKRSLKGQYLSFYKAWSKVNDESAFKECLTPLLLVIIVIIIRVHQVRRKELYLVS